jgi:predicted deacylase
VAVVALTHGNEIAGAAALARLLACGPRPAAGRLLGIFANHRATLAASAADPAAGRAVDRDLNRVWAPALLDGDAAGWEMTRARALRPLLARADLLLDLHSTATDDPPFLIAADKPAARALLARMPVPQHRVLMERPLHQGRLLIEAEGFADPDSPRVAIVAECGPHRAPATEAAADAIVQAFLAACGVVAAPAPGPAPAPRLFAARSMIVAASDGFRFARPLASFTPLAADAVYATDGDRALTPGFPRAVMLMPRRRPKAGGEAGLLAQELDIT